jgi:lysophospholipase L1-like esterase
MAFRNDLRLSLAAATLLLGTLPASAQQPLAFLPTGGTILFQGDSITDGGRQRTGLDYNHIMGQDYGYILAAEIGASEPARNFDFVNRGDSGDRVPDLAARWQADTLALRPDLLSILVGVNDFLGTGDRAETAEQFGVAYDQLLSRTIAALPNTKIVLGEPFLMPVGKYKAAYASERLEMKKRQAIVARLGAKYHLPIIPYQQIFDNAMKEAPADHWSWDGVHPTYAGHGLMVQAWLKTVDATWNSH